MVVDPCDGVGAPFAALHQLRLSGCAAAKPAQEKLQCVFCYTMLLRTTIQQAGTIRSPNGWPLSRGANKEVQSYESR
jgi:hypothetical protein